MTGPGPGGTCDYCGHFAARHDETGCHTEDLVASGVRRKPCDCTVFVWGGTPMPRPWAEVTE